MTQQELVNVCYHTLTLLLQTIKKTHKLPDKNNREQMAAIEFQFPRFIQSGI